MDNVTDGDVIEITSWTIQTDISVFPEYQAALIIWKIWPPCILVLGGFGNIATIFVLRRIKDNNSSQHVLLMALAVSDLTFLYMGALRWWISYVFDLNLRTLHTWTCKLHIWLIYSSGNVSAWLLTCVTVQRTMAIKWPHKMRMIWTLRRTWIVVVAIVLTPCALHSHLMLGKELSRDNKCTHVSPWYKDFIVVWYWVHLCISSLLPSLCLLVCDVILSLTLFKATSITSSTVLADSTVNTGHNKSRRKIASRTTVMILTLSCTFLLLTLPVCIVLLWRNYANVSENRTPRLYARSQLAYAVAMLLCYTNSAVNFLLYCFTGTKFRKEFLRWVSCGRHGHSTASVTDTSTGTSY